MIFPSDRSCSNGSWPSAHQSFVLALSFVMVVPQENYIADIIFLSVRIRASASAGCQISCWYWWTYAGCFSWWSPVLCRTVYKIIIKVFGLCSALHRRRRLFLVSRKAVHTSSSSSALYCSTVTEVVTSRAMILLITAWRKELLKKYSRLRINLFGAERTGWVSGITGLLSKQAVRSMLRQSQRFASAILIWAEGSHLHYCHVYMFLTEQARDSCCSYSFSTVVWLKPSLAHVKASIRLCCL